MGSYPRVGFSRMARVTKWYLILLPMVESWPIELWHSRRPFHIQFCTSLIHVYAGRCKKQDDKHLR